MIERIQGKLSELKIEMGECLAEKDIVSFESRYNVKLPQAYRMFLRMRRETQTPLRPVCKIRFIGEISN